MITASDLDRAERVLRIVYGDDLGRQLEALQVDREAVDNLVQHGWDVIDNHYRSALRAIDPRLQAAINTLLLHCLLVGMIAGRNSVRVIE